MSEQIDQSQVPFYLRKADRPKKTSAFHLHVVDIDLLNTDAYISVRSSFVRYLFDCFRAKETATPEGFIRYRLSGEKPLK